MEVDFPEVEKDSGLREVEKVGSVEETSEPEAVVMAWLQTR